LSVTCNTEANNIFTGEVRAKFCVCCESRCATGNAR
jgi:hypothetical protein